jgi:hypothetical protein
LKHGEGGENTAEREGRGIEVIPPNGRIAPLAAGIGEMVNSVMQRVGMSMGLTLRDVDYDELDEGSKKIVDAFMEKIRPEIEEKAKALLTAEIRDRIVRKADFVHIDKLLKKGQKISLKRKKGCIFAQFGSGEPEDPIDEFLLAST